MRLLLPLLSLAIVSFASAQTPSSPESHLGRPVGRDFELADWNEVSSYYTKLASETPRVVTEVAGKTT
ncbi:MAG: hypothetical protein IT459_08865, partial [Planctomycetes bacterium]|nr:hypothetical protein [Planctomycetota bacterium]